MTEKIHVLAQQLFGKSSVGECELQEIKDLVSRYPYFAPAHFLLLEKLKQENEAEYSAQLQKSVLYYHDPLEFEYFISAGRFETEIDPEQGSQSAAISPQPEAEQNVTDEILPELQVFPETFEEKQEPEPGVEETDVSGLAEGELTPAVEEKMAESIERVLEQEEEQITATISTDKKTDVLFEPFHTVDYFASQGIRLSQDEPAKDKFGKQLKSFTEWLRTMKRLPDSEISKSFDASAESSVQHLAEGSVHDAGVVTEAMAEVWIKQGNKEKAIETYNKLGLLNPSKKAYFAGLIENLKRS